MIKHIFPQIKKGNITFKLGRRAKGNYRVATKLKIRRKWMRRREMHLFSKPFNSTENIDRTSEII